MYGVRLFGMICLVISYISSMVTIVSQTKMVTIVLVKPRCTLVISYISSMLTIVRQTKTVTIVLVKPRCTFLNGV